jgi:hypothetical protein
MTINPWLRAGFSAWNLGVESSVVIAMRMAKLAAGGASGAAEAQLMVSEKIRAALALQTKAMTGGLGVTPHRAAGRTIAHYRRKVRANRRRLAKG